MDVFDDPDQNQKIEFFFLLSILQFMAGSVLRSEELINSVAK